MSRLIKKKLFQQPFAFGILFLQLHSSKKIYPSITMSHEKIATVLSKYIPPQAVEKCTSWIIGKNIHLKLTRGRASKYGDYRPLPQGAGHQITVNHDLNPFSFLITFVHEVAHLEAYNKYKRNHEPHGREWKNEYRNLLNEFIIQGVFPADITKALMNYIVDPSASSCTDLNLQRVLKKYNSGDESVLHLEDVPVDTVFRLFQSRNGLVFKKGGQIRKRFHCIEINTRRVYFVSPLAEVEIVGNSLK